ncbi:phosphodiesterase [Tautonia sociabilis]|uniref:Phosphodiesterase n=1 Tax=Tautonia sociabilis TaxID=2080755 RepID=A0A432MEJ9_9BACT|nr:phosphodiesterase [Tautonia sociabilis]
MEKVIVVGLDGLEPRLVGEMLRRGELPHLARLSAEGGLGRVATTSPAQTPVAWSSFATGTNPGGHGIFDFIAREPRSYRPDLALNRYEQPSPFLPARVVNLRRGQPVWDLLSSAGIRSVILRCPCSYPPDPLRGRLLSGMGVPDLRGGFGTGTFYTTDPAEAARESEQVVPLDWPGPGSGPIESVVIGPRNPKDRSDATTPLTIDPRPDEGRVLLRTSGTPGELELRPGSWSPWVRLRFKLGLLQGARGIVRFLLRRLEPGRLELYASPVNFDPMAPPFPISHPDLYAADLADELGLYHTTGMVEDHSALVNGRIDEAAFLSQCDDSWREREGMLSRELHRLDAGLLYCLFDTPDRVQHLFWRFLEPDHPANLGLPPDPEFVGAIAETYRRADSAVGLALEAADDRTLVIAMSDHGFGSFRRGVNLNAWLREHGLLALRDGEGPGGGQEPDLRQVDWSRTKAYALGLTGLYLNRIGREGQGIVPPDEAEGLKEQIARGLSGLVDPRTGREAIRGVDSRERAYAGPFVEEAPDLVVRFGAGYRVSWSGSLGGVSAGIFEDNTRRWSGDHIVDPALVPGLLAMNRPFRDEGAAMVDLAPTILEALGQPAGPAMEGRSLLR